jgi:hypothetical protein
MKFTNKANALEEIKAIVEANFVASGMGDMPETSPDFPPPTKEEMWVKDYETIDGTKFGMRELRDAIALCIFDSLFDTEGDSTKIAEAGSPTIDVGVGRTAGTDYNPLVPTPIINEDFSPSPQPAPGSNITFTTANNYKSGTLAVYVNGVRQRLVTEVTDNTFEIVAPAEGAYVFGDYEQAD